MQQQVNYSLSQMETHFIIESELSETYSTLIYIQIMFR